ncbi:DUF4279 domain-containing protein [Pectobacterium carotovorum]|uniref:DUF4279 domain-containing protein n=1 Tax=Pectobacterium carotovorum TaxID=554 RepID=UPI002116D5A8|nr:DUF4279 domain-containing protein [Pectobacterium carotovorum]MCQ8233626.1 DUF4279 domain-containing protein [Pectobacterium carotovorum]
MNPIHSRLNTVAHDFQTCLECHALLAIYPGEMHPDNISELLNIEPTERFVAGDEITNSIGRTRKVNISSWFLSSENNVDSKDLRTHIDWVIDKLNGSHSGLRELQSTSGVKMSLRCVWWSATGHSGPVLWPEQMKALADLDLECAFDIYFFPEE